MCPVFFFYSDLASFFEDGTVVGQGVVVIKLFRLTVDYEESPAHEKLHAQNTRCYYGAGTRKS